jgi:putative Holliday junction resolvase
MPAEPLATLGTRTLLSFDYGLRRIGVAVGQELGRTARPLCTLRMRDGKPDWAELEALIGTWQPDALVVGEPLNLDATEQAMTHAARRFAAKLQARFQRPVHLVDERLSSVAAEQRMASHTRKSARRDKSRIDSMAAALILETWFAQATHP